MNILIVGNGFDLSHYLPTKYTHFMYAMNSIYQNETIKFKKMKFLGDTLQCIEEEDDRNESLEISFNMLMNNFDENFIKYTKEYYYTENVSLNAKQAKRFKARLEQNL